jgi:hypothetical protein
MLAGVVLVQTRLAQHPVTAAQVAVVTVAPLQDQTERPIRAAAVADRKQLLAGLVVMAL